MNILIAISRQKNMSQDLYLQVNNCDSNLKINHFNTCKFFMNLYNLQLSNNFVVISYITFLAEYIKCLNFIYL